MPPLLVPSIRLSTIITDSQFYFTVNAAAAVLLVDTRTAPAAVYQMHPICP
jgi:hypothetical protein